MLSKLKREKKKRCPMIIEMIPISKLKLLENNPRHISKEQMAKLIKSIQDDPKFLECRPVLVNKTCDYPMLEAGETVEFKRIDTYTVYAGNQRVRAAKKLKMKEIPCIVECDLDEEILKSRSIKDNKTFGGFDFDTLANEWDIDLLLDCGFTADELMGAKLTNLDDDEINDDEEKIKCDKCGKKSKRSN